MNSANKSVVRYITVPLSRQEAWDLMWRVEGQLHFLGRQAQVDLKVGGLLRLSDETSDWRIAHIEQINSPKSITLRINPLSHWLLSQQTQAIISINRNRDDSRCTITVKESNIQTQYLDEITDYWDRRLHHLWDLARRVRQRRKKLRQALVVVHGIGEQQPGETLFSLTDGDVLDKDYHFNKWVKPDEYSDSYELRKVTLKGTATRPTTDVYEFYWAHLIQDTRLDHIFSWILSLLCRNPRSVPRQLLPMWSVGWLVFLVTVGVTVAVSVGVEIPEKYTWSVWLLALGLLLWRLFGRKFAIDYIGDAARYLRPLPANIAHRHAIRESGVAFIERLHSSGKYDRIVLVGHSLGSVIAYDIITYAWMHMHAKHQRPSSPAFTNIIDVERAKMPDKDNKNPEELRRKQYEFQNMQYAAWRQQRVNTQPWLITDLVTVGSPLTYADFLIKANISSFNQSKKARILPTCPPQAEQNGKRCKMRMTYEVKYDDPLTQNARTFVVFDHGAPFGVTRWTNLYFDVRYFGLSGDFIGGPVRNQLGLGIRDKCLKSPLNRFSHSWYWRKSPDKEDQNEHIQAFREALSLESRKDLADLVNRIPAFALLREQDMSRNTVI